MIPANQFLQCDVRLRQAKMQASERFGNLAMNICGDFLQLPPVEKQKGSRRSLALPLNASGRPEVPDEAGDDASKKNQSRDGQQAEGRQGFELWRSIHRVVCLSVNVRAPGALSRLQAEMRAGSISDEMWKLYLSRVMTENDPRLKDPALPFLNGDLRFIVHRHRIRVMRSMEYAKTYCNDNNLPLYVVQARDEAVRSEDVSKLTKHVRAHLLESQTLKRQRELQVSYRFTEK